jgi:hypothetical protein
MAHANVLETGALSYPSVAAPGDILCKWLGILGAICLLDLGKIDFRHGKRLATPFA